MAKEDLLSKQISQLGFVLKRMLEKLTGGISGEDFTESVSQVNVGLNDELGFDLEHVKSVPDEEIVSVLLQNEYFTPENIEIFADILLKADTMDFRNKALLLYEYVNLKTATFSMERNLKMKMIKNSFL